MPSLRPVLGLVEDRSTVETSSDNLLLVGPDQGSEGQRVGSDGQESMVAIRLRINKVDRGIMASKGKSVARGGECDRMNPSATATAELATQRVEGQLVAPAGRSRLFIEALDEGRKDTSLHVSRTSSQQDVVGMPVNGQDSAANGLLQVLTGPPVIVLFKVADGNTAGTTGNSKLLLIRRPADKSSSTVDTQQDKSRLPNATFVGPDIGVSVLRASDNTVGVGSKIDAGDDLVVLWGAGKLSWHECVGFRCTYSLQGSLQLGVGLAVLVDFGIIGVLADNQLCTGLCEFGSRKTR